MKNLNVTGCGYHKKGPNLLLISFLTLEIKPILVTCSSQIKCFQNYVALYILPKIQTVELATLKREYVIQLKFVKQSNMCKFRFKFLKQSFNMLLNNLSEKS